jgi:hypothetical protein
MSTSDLLLRYDGICVYATSKIKPNLVAIMILIFANLVFLTVITFFAIEGLPIPAIVFGSAELFIIKYTLWNFFGEERLIINDRSLSYQQHYGFFTSALHTIPFNKKIWIVDYDKVTQGNTSYVKFQFESYDKNSLPEVIYHSVLNITEADFKEFLRYIDRLFIDDLVRGHAMPEIHLN